MEKSLKRVSKYGKIMGILMMISGGISALTAIMTVIGAIPGALTVWVGYLLFQSGKQADEYLKTAAVESKEQIVKSFSTFLYVQGILSIVSIALIVPTVIFVTYTLSNM